MCGFHRTFILSFWLDNLLIRLQRDEHVLVVWADSLDQIIPLCKSFDQKLMKLAWHSKTNSVTPSILTSASNSSAPSTNASNINLAEKNRAKETVLSMATFAEEEKAALEAAAAVPPPPEQLSGGKWRLFGRKASNKVSDVEKAEKRPRSARLFAPLFVGAGAGLSVCKS
jgi:hypothetical protein